MDNKKRLSVGLKVCLKPIGRNAKYRGNADLVEYEVKKVGKKYFEVWRDEFKYGVLKFEIDNLKEVVTAERDWEFYFSKQDYEDKMEYKELINELTYLMGRGFETCMKEISLDKLRKIKEIINEK